MPSLKILHKGNFVKTNYASRRFPIGELRCYVCGAGTCAPVWAQMDRDDDDMLEMTRNIVCKPCMGDVFTNGLKMADYIAQNPPWWKCSRRR